MQRVACFCSVIWWFKAIISSTTRLDKDECALEGFLVGMKCLAQKCLLKVLTTGGSDEPTSSDLTLLQLEL